MTKIITVILKTVFLRDFLLHQYGVDIKGRRVVVIKSAYVNREIVRNITILGGNHKAIISNCEGYPLDIWLPIEGEANVNVSKSGNQRIYKHLYERLFHTIFCNKIDLLLMKQCRMIQTAIEIFMLNNGIEYNDTNFESLKKIYLRRNTAYSNLINEALGRRYTVEPTFYPISKGVKKPLKVDVLQGQLDWRLEGEV